MEERERAGKARITGETARIPWQELQRFFAQGVAVAVAPELDLIEVAWQMSEDNAVQVRAWMTEGRVGLVSDSQAERWSRQDTVVWSVVVRPWVLVQPVVDDHSA